jgi:hypothetical protein
MVIELVYVQGFETSYSIILLLNARSNKPGGITVKRDCLTRESYFTNQEIVAIEDANRTKYNTANQIAVWVLLTEHPLQTQGTAMF